MRKTILAAAFWLYGTALFDSTAGADMVVQACFSPQGKCAAHILREIESAKKELLVAVYAFTSDDLASALVQAKKRGVGVQVVIDREFDLANEKSKGKFLDAQKIPLRRISGSTTNNREKDAGLMHQKFAVIDRKIVFAGSYNWTYAAESSNDENLLLFRDAGPLAEEYRKAFVQPLGAETVKRSAPASAGVVLLAFLAGFLTHVFYQRWNPASEIQQSMPNAEISAAANDGASTIHRVSFVPFAAVAEDTLVDLPLFAAREVEKIRGLTGRQARIRGRVFRVGHSAKSNTYFLNFGPSREALTAVIFGSVTELFEKNKQPPKNFENREVELTGFIKDHPQYGLEVILEHPKQIKLVD